jgi:hypothetical protein
MISNSFLLLPQSFLQIFEKWSKNPLFPSTHTSVDADPVVKRRPSVAAFGNAPSFAQRSSSGTNQLHVDSPGLPPPAPHGACDIAPSVHTATCSTLHTPQPHTVDHAHEKMTDINTTAAIAATGARAYPFAPAKVRNARSFGCVQPVSVIVPFGKQRAIHTAGTTWTI